jgi:hypothetical protein
MANQRIKLLFSSVKLTFYSGLAQITSIPKLKHTVEPSILITRKQNELRFGEPME